jgi:glycosyltransferase involved in cell wall biosynthesis
MYHGNLAASLAAPLTGRPPPVLWNIRHSLHDLSLEKRATRLVIRAGAPLSRLAAGIVYNSALSVAQHRACGYARPAEVIPNGFDTDRFRPDPAARARLRAELGLGESTAVIGLVARYHPMKDHGTLVRAASKLRAAGRDLHLVLVGENVTPGNAELARAVAAAGLGGRASLLGERVDVPGLVPAFDVAVLCSAWGEGFPNVLGEAMACGVPCVTTDVGDCRPLLAGIGEVTPPGDADALAAALDRLLRLPPSGRAQLGAAGRRRVEREFALPAIAARYRGLYGRLVGRKPINRYGDRQDATRPAPEPRCPIAGDRLDAT